MRTIEEIRHARLMQLLTSGQYPTIQALANAIGRTHAQVSQWKNRSKRSSGGQATIDSASARHIEKCVGRPEGWMDHDPEEPAGLDAEAAQFAQRFQSLDEDGRHTWLALIELAEHRIRVDAARRESTTQKVPQSPEETQIKAPVKQTLLKPGVKGDTGRSGGRHIARGKRS